MRKTASRNPMLALNSWNHPKASEWECLKGTGQTLGYTQLQIDNRQKTQTLGTLFSATHRNPVSFSQFGLGFSIICLSFLAHFNLYSSMGAFPQQSFQPLVCTLIKEWILPWMCLPYRWPAQQVLTEPVSFIIHPLASCTILGNMHKMPDSQTPHLWNSFPFKEK